MAVYKEEKTNTWRAVYRYTDWNGERKQTQKRGFKTKREAQAWEREQFNKTSADLDMTFRSFVDLYTADMKTRLKENTWATKDHIVRTKLLPYFGRLKMCNITAQQIITWQNEMLNHKDENGKPYSPVYLKTVHNQLSAIFNHAVRYYKVHQGTVLYLALEDDESRLQRRMFRMFGVEGTSSLHFATSAKMIGSGLDEQLEKFVREHSDTKLIIVDTLQKVREMVSDNYSYSSDYEVIGKLKQFADRHGVCILIVHHTRKQPAGDSFEKISGTTGLSGCADGALIMQKEKRTDGKATLEISGRDQPDQRLYLSKDQERLVWLLDHAENELWKQSPDPVLEAVAKIVSDANREWEGSPTELSEALQLNMAVNRLTKHLNVNASRLLEEHQVKYENKTKHAGRRIRLTYMVEAPMVEVIK